MNESGTPPVPEPAVSAADGRHECVSCGAPYATAHETPDGMAWLCRECATLHGLGCP